MALQRFKLLLQYDGSDFSGWQRQNNKRTVQGSLEDAVKKICKFKKRIPIYGSGRTDAGVHSLGQVAHVDVPFEIKSNELQNALNGNLPNDCRILNVSKVGETFHARYSAKKRYYKYQVYQGESILYRNQSWVLQSLDINHLNQLAKLILGEHDFLSFCKFRKDVKSTNCFIYTSLWKYDKNMLTYFIEANRFLHHMIRYLVGTMIAVIHGRYTEEEFTMLLFNPKKDVKIFKAPAAGLILNKIDYV